MENLFFPEQGQRNGGCFKPQFWTRSPLACITAAITQSSLIPGIGGWAAVPFVGSSSAACGWGQSQIQKHAAFHASVLSLFLVHSGSLSSIWIGSKFCATQVTCGKSSAMTRRGVGCLISLSPPSSWIRKPRGTLGRDWCWWKQGKQATSGLQTRGSQRPSQMFLVSWLVTA